MENGVCISKSNHLEAVPDSGRTWLYLMWHLSWNLASSCFPVYHWLRCGYLLSYYTFIIFHRHGFAAANQGTPPCLRMFQERGIEHKDSCRSPSQPSAASETLHEQHPASWIWGAWRDSSRSQKLDSLDLKIVWLKCGYGLFFKIPLAPTRGLVTARNP